MGTAEQPGRFHSTRWTLIRRAQGQQPAARAALAELCGIYWYPLYAFVRAKTRGQGDEAADLTQAFFARLLEKQDLEAVDPKFGRFRSWLLASMTHFLHNEWDRQRAQKRGGGAAPISIDAAAADAAWQRETAHTLTPEKLYERKLTLVLLERVLAALEAEYAGRGKAALFQKLKGVLTGDPTERYAQIAAELGMSEGAVKVAVFAMREQHARLLRAEVAELVDGEEEIAPEIEGLLESLL